MIDPNNPYTKMQRKVYDQEAKHWSPTNRDPVVGSWDKHNQWEDYDLLFESMEGVDKIALDFGCGPGRNILKYRDRFDRIDGADISRRVLEKAADFLNSRKVTANLIHINGVDLEPIVADAYDVIFSTICLQHIPVHPIRMNLFREFARVLRAGGWFTAQMGFGDNGDPRGVSYYTSKYDVDVTNGGCDVKVTDPKQLERDLIVAGFGEFSFLVRPTGPGDWHPYWIFFRARKE